MISDEVVNILLSKEGMMIDGIVFLPYCYAMWDCMKSVFETCLKRNIPCGVMPIPYFTLKDGRIDQWHYEYDLFKDEIEEEDLLDFNRFDELDFSYVVIHNPYDDGNILTTVHPFFYSSVLKEKRKKIIFIPYGIPNNGVSNDLMRLTKGALNSDYIFVNGEEERLGMIESFKKIGVDMTDRCYATGSPKLDSLFEKKEMPREWKTKVYRRITLVCNSLVPFMKNPEGKLSQYRKMILKEMADGKVVIFRPHPLMDETIRTQIPELYDAWQTFNELIAKNDRCILDTDSDLATAIQFSDYLISDPSSVVQMWMATGKPFEVM